MPKGDHVLNFSDAEDMINDKDLVYVSNCHCTVYCLYILYWFFSFTIQIINWPGCI